MDYDQAKIDNAVLALLAHSIRGAHERDTVLM